MSNFAPKLEDATEKELRYMVNELDFRVVPLASDELTRRTISRLQKTIELSNKYSEKLELANYRLQKIMVVLTGIGTLVITFPIFKWVFDRLAPITKGMFKDWFMSPDTTSILSATLSLFVVYRTLYSLKDKKVKDIVKNLMP